MKPWALAIGLSLALHLGLILAFRDLPPSPPRGERVVETGEPFVAFTPVTVAERPPATRKIVKSAPVTPSGVEGPPVVETSLAPLSDPLPRGGEGDSAETASSPHPDPLPARGEGDSVVAPHPDIIALVHARLAAMADRCYPAAARRFQQRGTVQLSFCTDATGAAANTAITQSSGAELLDAAARGCVIERAAPFPPEAASRCFAVPVRFGAR